MKYLCQADAGTGARDILALRESVYRETVLAQASFSSTGTVNIEGRLRPDFDWEVVATIAHDDTDLAVRLSPFPEMRVNITANAGTVTAGLNV